MEKKANIVPLKDLNLVNRFLFDEVMEDAQTHREALSIIFGKEIPECKLEDGAVRIFLNTRGQNEHEVSEELVEFLHYLEDSTDERVAASKSERIKRIHSRVCKVKLNEEVGVKYMQAWEEKYFEREEGREEGRTEGERLKLISLIQKKILRGKSLEETADALEEEPGSISELYDLISRNQGKTEQEIFDLWNHR